MITINNYNYQFCNKQYRIISEFQKYFLVRKYMGFKKLMGKGVLSYCNPIKLYIALAIFAIFMSIMYTFVHRTTGSYVTLGVTILFSSLIAAGLVYLCVMRRVAIVWMIVILFGLSLLSGIGGMMKKCQI